MGSTLYEKIWNAHVVREEPGQAAILYIDMHLVHEVTSPQAFEGLKLAGRKIRRPKKVMATMDHNVPTRFRSGIVHVVAPEKGLTMPGMTVVCGDSHTATHGALGALAFGIGTSEVEHVLATQTLQQKRSKTMKIEFRNKLAPGITSKDMILHLIGTIGAAGGTGYVFEYCGEAVSDLSVEARMTICNMSIEGGARAGMIAPDEKTIEYLKSRPYAPKGELMDKAVAYWKTLKSDADAKFDRVLVIDSSKIEPQVTWGTNPGQVTAVNGTIPRPKDFENANERQACENALQYMGLKSGTKITDLPLDYVFIGSCTNSRIEDLREASRIVKGKKVNHALSAVVVPGSGLVKQQAEKEGLDRIFKEAGFEWREAGCSMCLAMNDDYLQPGQRCASTSNRNFEGRQGKGGRTHLVSPAMAAAAAIKGRFVDFRELV
ncbi:hypothetical protein CHS0354_002076 [Potamilus streckersoni]|uniref:3-isopropylmalate dehydratase n=1 Tax=Potamilus streckersoni TaxID=2493646 RepID=A0AAE0T6U8_9BIVA|nr:hypothetical protein CHS0354_002076 [Potamilus streckersoni]